MFKDQSDIYYEIKKRPQEKPLSFSELAALREVPYKYFKSDPIFLELLNQYCRDSKFQIRVCERSFIMTTIVPLMHKDNPLEVIQASSESLALLSENRETHEKILKSGAMRTIAMLIRDNIHFQITKYCIMIFSNLCHDACNFTEILSLHLHKILVTFYLDQVDFETQSAILQILIQLCTVHPDNLYSDDMRIILRKRKYCAPLVRVLASPNQAVALHTIVLFTIFLENEEGVEKLLKQDLPPRLLQVYRLFVSMPGNEEIIRVILELMEQMLKYQVYLKILTEEQYIQVINDSWQIDNFEIQYRSLSCLTRLSENVDTQSKLIELGILNSMCELLQHNKDIKLRRQALKFISNLSFNPSCMQLLINQTIMDLIIFQLNSSDKESRIQSVTTISNLSGAPNFHKKLQNINIKSLIHIFESEHTSIEVMRSAANTLANISLDHMYQSNFMKDPEKSILLTLIRNQEDIEVLKSVIIIFSNVVSNQSLSFASEDLLEIFLKLYFDQKAQEVRGYVAKLLIAIMTMIYCSKDMHMEFLESNGIDCLLFILNRTDGFQIYLSFKCFSLLSRWEKNIDILTSDEICSLISRNSMIRERRILKEGLRFFINILVYKRSEKEIVNRLCWLINEGLRESKCDVECLKLSLFALMIVSEQPSFHKKLISHPTLLTNLAVQTYEELSSVTDFYAKILMNLSLNSACHEDLLDKQFVRLTKDICQHIMMLRDKADIATMNSHSYILTFACQMLKMDTIAFHINKLFEQGIVEILNMILQQSYEFMFQEIIEAFNIILAQSDFYPDSLFDTITKLADDSYMINDNQTVYMRVYILMSLSTKPGSGKYFKYCRVIKLIKHFLERYMDWSINIVPNCCMLLANIAKEPDLLKAILEENLINLIFKIWSEKNIISFTDLIRLLAQITSLPLFSSSYLDENIYPFVFDFLYQQVQEEPPQNSLISASLLCVLNMTKSDFGLARAISKSSVIDLIKTLMERSQGNPKLLNKKSTYNQLMICVLMVSNLLIDSEFARSKKDAIISILNCMRCNVECLRFADSQINTGFLKILHNLVIQNYTLKSEPLVVDSIELAYQLFNVTTDVQCQTYILNMMNHLLQDRVFFETFKDNQLLMTKISDQFLAALITPQAQNNEFRFSLYTFLTNLSFYEGNIEFFESFLSLSELVSKFRSLFTSSSKAEQEALLCFLANLANIKEIQSLMLKSAQTMQLIKGILIEHRSDALAWTAIRLLANISANQDFHPFIAQEDILKCLSKVFMNPKTNVGMKEKIQSLLANMTFTKRVHEVMIKNDCIRILELILNKESQLEDTNQKHMLTSMIQLGLNHKNFHMIENQVNMVNSLSMVNECDKILQVKLLQVATRYILDTSQDNAQNKSSKIENKIDISREIMSYVKMSLETRSAYFVRSLEHVLTDLSSWEHFSTIPIDATRLTSYFVNVIIQFANVDTKIGYFRILKQLISSDQFFNTASFVPDQLAKLLKFAAAVLDKVDTATPKTISEQNRIKGEHFIVLFLQLLSNCSVFGRRKADVIAFIVSSPVEQFISAALRFGKQKSYNVLSQVICTLSSFYQNEQVLASCYTYPHLFLQLHAKYKKYIAFNRDFEYYLAGLIGVVLKVKNYLLTEAIAGSSENTINNAFAFTEQSARSIANGGTQNMTSTITPTNAIIAGTSATTIAATTAPPNAGSQNTQVVPASVEQKTVVTHSEENKFMFSFLIMTLKKGGERSSSEVAGNDLRQQGEAQTLQCIANIAAKPENTKLILATKLPEHLFVYLSNSKTQTLPFYSFAITAFLSLARAKEIYARIKCDDIFKWFKNIVDSNRRDYIEKCMTVLIFMIDEAKYEDFLMYAEDIVEFITRRIISNSTVNDPLLDKILILFAKIIRIQGLIYKIAKIEVLFQSLFRFLESQDISEETNFSGYIRVWELVQNFFESRECLSYLIKYGLVRIIQVQLNYFQDSDRFLANAKDKRKKDARMVSHFMYVLSRLKLLGLLLGSVNLIFSEDLLMMLPVDSRYRLVYAKEKNDQFSSTRVLNIHFADVYDVLTRIQSSTQLSQPQKHPNHLLILSHVLLNVANVLIRLNESSCLYIVKFLIEMLRRFEVPTETPASNIEDNLAIRLCIFQTLNMLLERYEPTIHPHLDEILNIMVMSQTNGAKEMKLHEEKISSTGKEISEEISSKFRQVYLTFLNFIVKIDFKSMRGGASSSSGSGSSGSAAAAAVATTTTTTNTASGAPATTVGSASGSATINAMSNSGGINNVQATLNAGNTNAVNNWNSNATINQNATTIGNGSAGNNNNNNSNMNQNTNTAADEAQLKLAARIFGIIKMNQSNPINKSDSVVRFFFLIFVKKFLLSVDIRTHRDLIESYQDVIDPINDFIVTFNSALSTLRGVFQAKVDFNAMQSPAEGSTIRLNSSVSYSQKFFAANAEELETEAAKRARLFMKELDSNNIVLAFETLILLVYFLNEFKAVEIAGKAQTDIIASSFQSAILILQIEDAIAKLSSDESETILSENHVKQSDLNAILKADMIFINQVSYFQQLQSSMFEQHYIKVLIDTLTKKRKTTQMYCYNTLTNLSESNGLLFLKTILIEIERIIREGNQRMVKRHGIMSSSHSGISPGEMEPLVGLLEHAFVMVADLEKSQSHQSPRSSKEFSATFDVKNAKRVILELCTELVIEKGGIILSESFLTIFFTSAEEFPDILTRFLYLLMKQQILEENTLEAKDFVLKRLRSQLVSWSHRFTEIFSKESELRILTEEYQDILRADEEEAAAAAASYQYSHTTSNNFNTNNINNQNNNNNNNTQGTITIANTEFDAMNQSQIKGTSKDEEEDPHAFFSKAIQNTANNVVASNDVITPAVSGGVESSSDAATPKISQHMRIDEVISDAAIHLNQPPPPATMNIQTRTRRSNTSTPTNSMHQSVVAAAAVAAGGQAAETAITATATTSRSKTLQQQQEKQLQQLQQSNSHPADSSPQVMNGSQGNQTRFQTPQSGTHSQQMQHYRSSQQIKSTTVSATNVNGVRRKSTQSAASKTLSIRQARKKKVQIRIQQLQTEFDRIGVTPLNIPVVLKFLDRPIRNYQSVQSMSNAFFWEFFVTPLTPYQSCILNWMFGLGYIELKSRSDVTWKNLLMLEHDSLLKILDLEYVGVYKQPGFLFAKSIGETILNLMQNKAKKTDTIKSDKFSILRKSLVNSKIRELVDLSKNLDASMQNA